MHDALLESRAACVEVIAEPPRDEDVTDGGQAGREARDGADLGEPEVKQARCAEAGSSRSKSTRGYAIARLGRGGGDRAR